MLSMLLLGAVFAVFVFGLTAMEELNAALKKKGEAIVGLMDRWDGEPNPSDAQKTAWGEEFAGLEAEMKALTVQRDELERREKAREGAKSIIRDLSQPANPMTFGEGGGNRGAAKGWGDRFLTDTNVAGYLKSLIQPGGHIPEKARVTTPGAVIGEGVKSLLTGLTTWSPRADTNAGAMVPIDQRGLLDMGYWQRPLRIADLVSKGETTGDVIEYVRMTGVTNNAAPVAESTATSGSSGVKPESAMAFEVVHDRIRTVAHWVPATRRALADAGQLRTIIDLFLRYGLAEELEDQMIAGDGTGENFTGILNVSGKLSQAYDDDLLTTARTAITNLLLNGRVVPSGWAMHPTNWLEFDLLSDNENRYFFGGPRDPGQPRLWGVPVVQSEAVTLGHGILADWRYAMLWDREQTTIYVSDSHADFFVRNLLAVLAELRAGFGIIRPKAFCDVDLTE